MVKYLCTTDIQPPVVHPFILFTHVDDTEDVQRLTLSDFDLHMSSRSETQVQSQNTPCTRANATQPQPLSTYPSTCQEQTPYLDLDIEHSAGVDLEP